MDRSAFRSNLNFKILAKLFFDLAEERYPASDKILQVISKVIDPLTNDPYENIHLKIAVLSIMRQMVKEVSPNKLYRTLQHRDDLYMAIVEASEELEDQLEEIEERMAAEEEDEE